MDNINQDVEAYIEKYPDEIKTMFIKLRELIISSTEAKVEEKLWAKLPSYYVGEKFIRLLPFKDHINIEASAIAENKEELTSYKLTPKGMLQVSVKQELPENTLKIIFKETLTK